MLDELAKDFWNWRVIQQPISYDDIPRMDRPRGWIPKWALADVEKYREALLEFENRWKNIDASSWPVSRQVDYRLIGSAIARVRWELEVARGWQRNPLFYVDQALGPLFLILLKPSGIFDSIHSKEIILRISEIPKIIEVGQENLIEPIAPFARLAILGLTNVSSGLNTVTTELTPRLAEEFRVQLAPAMKKASAALEEYRGWLQQRLPQMRKETAVGRDNYLFFLKKVALVPFTPERLLAMGKQEWERSVAFESYEKNRNAGLPQLLLFHVQAEQMARSKQNELDIREFLEEKGILTVPSWLRHYTNLPLPSYIAPLADLGVTDDLTSPNRLNENAVSYIPVPLANLGFFALASAHDPRPIIVHEGVPGHYCQLALSWAQPNEIRRHYYDSGSNEGIAFYAEEMMLQAGLFDDSPHTREIIYSFMRLRALRVEVDVKLALGEFNIPQAAEYLQRTVPMDQQTAGNEAAFFAASPGQAITYQIGKLQILKFLADARRMKGDAFNLRAFHDYVWTNGNVPLSLQRWEYLGLRDEIDLIDR